LPVAALVRDGFPDEFGDVDDEIRFFLIRIAGRADLADADADDVVEPAVRLPVGQVQCDALAGQRVA
jgi:hypothetical protein